MPSKYSHRLVLSQQQYWGAINPDPILSSKPSSSPDSRSHTRSNGPSIPSPSNKSTQSSARSNYLRLEPDPEPEPSYDYRISTHTARPPSRLTTPSASQCESPPSQRSQPPSDRLRLESPFGFRIEDPPSSPPLSERPYHHPSPSPRPNTPKSPPSDRLRLEDPSPLRPRKSRPALHHKSSSVETQIYAPEPTTSPPPTRGGQDLLFQEAYEAHPSFQHPTSPASTKERQHVFSMESPESSPPPVSIGDSQERLSSGSQRSHLTSPPRCRRQRSTQKTQALASPPPVQRRPPQSPFGTQDAPLFPSAKELQDYFSIAMQGSQSIPAKTGDRQEVSSPKARTALPTPSQDSQTRRSLDTQRYESPRQTRDHQRRPSLGTPYISSGRGSQTTHESVHDGRQSIDSQTTRGRQRPPSLGPRRPSVDQFTNETQQRPRESIDSKTAKERQLRPSSSSQQLSLKQFVQESEHIREPSLDSQIYSPQSLSTYTGNPRSRRTTLDNTQRYTPKSTTLEHSPRSRPNWPSKISETSAAQHRILSPTSQGSYDNVLIETHGFPPKRPPSPPATPDLSKSFSLAPQIEETKTARPAPPIPQRSARRSPPRQGSTNSSVVHLPSEPPRPRTSSAVDRPSNLRKTSASHSPTFSISPRRSSINATMSPRSVSFSDFSETIKSPGRVSLSQSGDGQYFDDADLESLPPEIDFNVLPYENPNAGPAVFRATQLGLENPISPRCEDPNAGPGSFHAPQLGPEEPVSHDGPASSRASSFDSAAPPPIGLNRRISHATAEPYQPKMPKKDSRMSILSFLRSSSAPKAVLYSEATQGQPPVSVSVSRTAVPSIPLLFPRFRGQFPPPQKIQDKGFRFGLEPRMRAGLRPKTGAPRSPAHADAAEKRKSWRKGDDVNKSRGALPPANKWELERILSNL